MKAQDLRKKSSEELNIELINLLRKQFNFRMQVKNNQLKKTHLLKQVRHNLARIKTILAEKAEA